MKSKLDDSSSKVASTMQSMDKNPFQIANSLLGSPNKNALDQNSSMFNPISEFKTP